MKQLTKWIGGRLGEQRGAVLILTSLALIGVLGISAFVVDIGNANQRGRTAQSAVDASAIAGGWDLPTVATARTTAADYVETNINQSLPAPTTCPTGDSITANTICYETGSKEVRITTPWDSSEFMLHVKSAMLSRPLSRSSSVSRP